MDLSTLTSAQLTTLKANALAALNAITGSQSYQIGSRQLSRMKPDDALKILDAVSREEAARADATGGLGIVEFNQP